MIRAATVMVMLVVAAGGASGQTGAAPPSFEVASVKVSAPLPNGMMFMNMGGGPGSTDPGRVTYNGINLRSLVARAYGVKDYQVEGPQWLETERYDIIATIPKGAGKEQVGLMMQGLLAERFKLTLHHESKPLAVYTLSVGKGGPKLKEVDPATLPTLPAPLAGAPPPPPPPGGRGPMPAGAMRMMMGPNNRRLSANTTLAQLCDMLSNFLDRPVIDLTELKATYEIDLAWTPDENEKLGGKLAMGMAQARGAAGPPPDGRGGGDGNAAVDPGLSLAQALQVNYGLKLEARKNPADFVVIDHAEKVPTEN
jgi:uncharacterized protein (TIGR03435 family)